MSAGAERILTTRTEGETETGVPLMLERYRPAAVRGYDAGQLMRVFSVEPDGGFTEYEQLPFETDHAEADLEQDSPASPVPHRPRRLVS